MKRCIAAVVILVLVICASLTTAKIINTKADSMLELTRQVYSQNEGSEKLKDEWKKSSIWFSLLIDHGHLEPISAKISELEYLSEEDKQENCAQLLAQLQEIKEHIAFSLYTVF